MIFDTSKGLNNKFLQIAKDVCDKFLAEVKKTVEEHDVPPSLLLNCDHTGVPIVPFGTKSYEVIGSKRVPIAHVNDKRSITALPLVASDGKFPGMQLIYAGKGKGCHPKNSSGYGTMAADCKVDFTQTQKRYTPT